VSAEGAIHLGDKIVCDGFHLGASVRVQTHVHDDHMGHFDRSKGLQNVVMTPPTRDLLIAERNADLPYRDNIIAVDTGVTLPLDGANLTLVPNAHMLGSAQVAVETDLGRLGYSGDFAWPMEEVIEVDALVVDSTYGSPESVREYGEGDAEARFLELIFDELKRGRIHLCAHRGTLHRALELLAGQTDAPLLGSRNLVREVEVYKQHGCCVDDITVLGSTKSSEIVKSGRYIRLYSKGDRFPRDSVDGTKIILSAFLTNPNDPVATYSEKVFRVALSNHADFKGTLEYVEATKAKYVITDNTRGGNGVVLAAELRQRLGIKAKPSSNIEHTEWN
jgi:putative mRNA 3-end processing factor